MSHQFYKSDCHPPFYAELLEKENVEQSLQWLNQYHYQAAANQKTNIDKKRNTTLRYPLIAPKHRYYHCIHILERWN